MRRIVSCHVIGLVLFLGVPSAGAQHNRETSCSDLFMQGKRLAPRNLGKACERLQSAVDSCQREKPDLQEKLRWLLAYSRLHHAQDVKNSCQKYELGDIAVSSWSSYINWYTHTLSQKEREALPAEQNRIQAAIGFLQAAVKERGEPTRCPGDNSDKPGIRQMFSLMTEVKPPYVSADAMTVWNNWLWRCPSWENPRNPQKELKNRVCVDGSTDTCIDDWRAHRNFLQSWLDLKGAWQKKGEFAFRQGMDLSKPAIDSFKGMLNVVNAALECEH